MILKAKRTVWMPNPGAQQRAWERMDIDQLFFGGGRGCVHPDTLLDTPNGKVKIKDFKGGLIYSMKDGEVIQTYATPPIQETEEDLYEVKTGTDFSVKCTDEHKFFTSDYEWKMLKDLGEDPFIMTAIDYEWIDEPHNLCFSNVMEVKKVGRERYWDIHVPETNCYFAEGILHHNSGKTSWLLGLCLAQWELYKSSARCLILRRQFRDLREIIRQAKEMLVLTGLAKYNASEHIFYGQGRYAGATIELGNLERMDDYGRYHGNAYSLVCFDEITEFVSWEMVDRMGSTLRSKDPKVKCIMRFTGNPGGRLHQEVKRRFYDPAPKGGRLLKLPDRMANGVLRRGQTRMMIHSTVQDNPYLWENDPDYVTWLLSLPETLRKAWFEGCWDIAIGSFFNDVWDARIHVVNRINPLHVPANWEIRRAFDWGSSTPFCNLWYTISDGSPMLNGMMFPRGAIIFLWELYGQDLKSGKINEGLRLSDKQQAEMIRKMEIDLHIHERVIPGPADNQIYANTNGRDSNFYINFEKEGVFYTRSNKSPGSAKVGWQQIRNRLIGKDAPMMYFTENCVNCIRTIPELISHETKIDDIADNQEDHCFVAGTMISMADGTEKPIESVKVGEWVATRTGFGQVEASNPTRADTDVCEVELSNGVKVTCTPDHNFFAHGIGRKEIRCVDLDGDSLLFSSGEIKWSKRLSSTVAFIEDIRIQSDILKEHILKRLKAMSEKANQHCTVTNGYSSMEKFQLAMKSITGTWITTTTKLRTMNASQRRTIDVFMQKTGVGNAVKNLESTSRRYARRLLLGINQMRAGNGIAKQLKSLSGGLTGIIANGAKKTLSLRTKTVDFVTKIAVHHGAGLTAGTIFKWSAYLVASYLRKTKTPESKHALSLVVVKSLQPKGKATVYNLTIKGDHSYFANGILVMNCADVVKYVSLHHPMGLVGPQQPPRKPPTRLR